MEMTRIALFGMTGSGKSTICNMLYQGEIYATNNRFEIGKNSKGITAKCVIAETDKYRLIDTIGLGEPIGGTVDNKTAQNEIISFLTNLKKSINYVCYVRHSDRGRTLKAEQNMYKIVQAIYKGAEQNIVVIFTGTDEDWLNSAKNEMVKQYGDVPMIAVNFPPVNTRRPNTEQDNIIQRQEDITRLIKWFKDLSYPAVKPDICKMTNAELAGFAVTILLLSPFILAGAAVGIAIGIALSPIIIVGDIIMALSKKNNKQIVYEGLKTVGTSLKTQIEPSLNQISDIYDTLSTCQQDVECVDYGPAFIKITKPSVNLHRHSRTTTDSIHSIEWSVVLMPWIDNEYNAIIRGADQSARSVAEEQYRASLESALPEIRADVGFNFGLTATVGSTVNTSAIAQTIHLARSSESQIHVTLNSKPITITHTDNWEISNVKALLSVTLNTDRRLDLGSETIIYNYKSQMMYVYKEHNMLVELVFIAENVDPEYFSSDTERGYKITDTDTYYEIVRTSHNVTMACEIKAAIEDITSRECWKWAMKHIYPENINGVVHDWEFDYIEKQCMITTPAIMLGMICCKYSQLEKLVATCYNKDVPVIHVAPIRTMAVSPNYSVTYKGPNVRIVVGKNSKIMTQRVIIG